MKVILTGSTGFIGSEVLEQCLANKSITSIVVLSRRTLPENLTKSDPKVKVVIMKDFGVYTDEAIHELEGADACIWALGKALVKTDEEARRIHVDYTLAAARAFRQIASKAASGRFRFVYLSGKLVEKDQTKSLWFMQGHRRIRGQLETELIAFADAHKDSFEAYIARPSMVISKQPSLVQRLCSCLIDTVKVNVLAGTMVNIAAKGSPTQTFENADFKL